MNLQWVETSFPSGRDWTEADRALVEDPWARALNRRIENRVVDVSPDELRQMPDVDLNVVFDTLKDSVVSTSLDGALAQMERYRGFTDVELGFAKLRHAMAILLKSWEQSYPALAPKRSIRRRRREARR